MHSRFALGRGLILAGVLLAAHTQSIAQRHGGGWHGGHGGGWDGGHGGDWHGGHGYNHGYGGYYGYARYPLYYGPRFYGGYWPYYGGYYPYFPAVIVRPVIWQPPVYAYPLPPPPPAAPATQQCPDGSTVAVGTYCPAAAQPAPAPIPMPSPERGERG